MREPTTKPRTWRDKANEIIAALSYAAWRDANHDKSGRRYVRHRPYHVPAEATLLVEMLGANDEAGAKGVFERMRLLGTMPDGIA